MGNGMGSGTEMSAERERGGQEACEGGVDRFLHSHISSLACGWEIAYPGSVFTLTSCESENATALASPPGFHTSSVPQRPLTSFGGGTRRGSGSFIRRWLYCGGKGAAPVSSLRTKQHVNAAQELNSLPHISSPGCCPNNLSSLKL